MTHWVISYTRELEERAHLMSMNADMFSGIRVLVCLANPDQGTELAHALREQGLDVLVAHQIRSAMRVMAKENPQAVIVEVATKAYDGFRVAQWARGRVRAIFLVAERQLTRMEDVEVLSSGARELFYTPLQAETIAASIRNACGDDSSLESDDASLEPKTQYSDPSQVMQSHAAHTVRSVSVIDPSAKTEAVQAVTPEDLAAAAAGTMDTITEAKVILPESLSFSGGDTVESAPTLVGGEFARRPSFEEVEPTAANSEPMSERAPDEVFEDESIDHSDALVADLFGDDLGPAVIDPNAIHGRSIARTAPPTLEPEVDIDPIAPSGSTEPDSHFGLEEVSDESSAALVDDLFGSPSEGHSSGARSGERTSAEGASAPRSFEAPPDDEFLTAGMMDDLEDLSTDSITGRRSTPDAPPEDEPEPVTSSASEDEELAAADVDKQDLLTEHVSGPSTVDVIQAAYGTSSTPKWLARALLASVLAAAGWVGWLALERMSPAPDTETSAQAATDAASEARSLLHSTLGEAAISHRSGELEEAKKHYEQAIEQDPDNDVALRGLVAIAIKNGEWTTARDKLNALGELAPDDPMLPLQQGLVLSQLGKVKAARAELLRFIDSTKPEDPRQGLAARVYLSLSGKQTP